MITYNINDDIIPAIVPSIVLLLFGHLILPNLLPIIAANASPIPKIIIPDTPYILSIIFMIFYVTVITSLLILFVNKLMCIYKSLVCANLYLGISM